MITKAEYTKRWQTYWDAYRGDYFRNENLPDYKSNLVSNYIFSVIETIRPIMLDNDPKFQVLPRNIEGMHYSNDLQSALSYEFDREGMNLKMYRELINTLVTGTSIFFIRWDSDVKQINSIPVNPFNLFPDPLATSIEDAEYLIYASYKNVVQLRGMFPERADELHGGQVNYSELVNDNDRNARIDNQILVLEIWTKDYELDTEIIGREKKIRPKYPKGRVLIICPELGITLSDKESPYNDGKFPFVLIRDYDIPGKFWGEGEVVQLISPQKHMNDLNNAILDNAKTTSNMPWIVDKNSGVGIGKITARPGLVIRKNPGTEVRRDQPPQMPMYVINAVETYKSDIEHVSGIFNALRGQGATGVYTAQGLLALQEAGQVRIRLKVKLLEEALGKMAELWYSRMRQFWKEEKFIRVTQANGDYDIRRFKKEALEYDYDIKICGGSTMPVNRGAMLDMMIRLAQTPMPDGMPLVDREAVMHYLPQEIRPALMERMQGENMQIQQIMKTVQQMGEGLGQLNQGLQQITKESQTNDEQTFTLLDEFATAIEKVNQQILQLKEEHDKIEEERVEEEKENKIKREAYNLGFKDAEEIYVSDVVTEDVDVNYDEQNIMGMGLNEMPGIEEDPDAMPDEILDGLERLSDKELEILMEQYPELIDVIK